MRPASDVRKALIGAVQELETEAKGPTMRELAAKACVGYTAARRTLDNLRRAGVLEIPRGRKVHYRNAKVAEYALSKMAQTRPADGWAAWQGVADSFCRPAA